MDGYTTIPTWLFYLILLAAIINAGCWAYTMRRMVKERSARSLTWL